MNRRDAARVLGIASLAGLAAPAGLPAQRGRQEEAAEHPRIAAAIRAINDAIDYMQQAPHDFGGHRVAAIQASRAAVEQLRLALAYRAAAERSKRH